MGQSDKRHIGRILLDGGFLSQQDLDTALAEQKHTKELLGQVLVKKGVLKVEDINVPLIIQAHLGTIDKGEIIQGESTSDNGTTFTVRLPIGPQNGSCI